MIKQSSPFTFFAMDSEDDFDPYGSDVPSDLDTKRDLLGMWSIYLSTEMRWNISVYL